MTKQYLTVMKSYLFFFFFGLGIFCPGQHSLHERIAATRARGQLAGVIPQEESSSTEYES